MVSRYQKTFSEYESLVAAHPAWSLSDIRRMPVRERKHWIALALHDIEVREAQKNG